MRSAALVLISGGHSREANVCCTKVVKLFRIYTAPDVLVGGAFVPGGNGVGLKSSASTPVLAEETRYCLNNLCFSYLTAPNHCYIFWNIFLKSY